MKISEFIARLQGLPENKKKIVLWTIIMILGLIMGYFWLNATIDRLQKIGESVSQIKFPEIQTQETELPSAQLPADQTADWKTYTNTEYGFEIKYPSDLRVIDNNFSEFPRYFLVEKVSKEQKTVKIILSLEIINQKADYSSYLNQPDSMGSDVVVAGVKGKTIKIVSQPADANIGTNEYIFTEKDGLTYIFNYNYGKIPDSDYILFNQILSTFRFIK